MKLTVSILLLFNVVTTSLFSQIYVAPDGSDDNPGTMDQPFESIQRAQTEASAGDTVFIRGGMYKMRPDQISRVEQNLYACITFLDKSGSEGKTIKYWAYPGETPVFDFSDINPTGQRIVGIWVAGEYIHIKGLEMTGIQINITSHTESFCIYSWGNYNTFEQISMHDNKGTGLRHRRGGHNLFLNCDAYRNHDDVSENKLGGNTDGFGCHPNSSGTGNVFRGCRSWFNSDDGYDVIRSGAAVVFDHCWAFYNGYSPSFDRLADGNGFKGGGYAYDDAADIPNPVPRNTIRFCIAVRNKANGFYSNHHLAGNYWYNNTAYMNNVNFNMVNRESPQSDNINVDGYDHVLKNNLAYKARNSETAYIDTARNTLVNNSFYPDLALSDDDFVSLDMDQLTAPRKEDGSLPDIDFMRPAQGSAVIDAGVDIGFEFSGDAPELGAIEVDYNAGIFSPGKNPSDDLALYQNYPNPFHRETTIHYALLRPGYVDLSVYSCLGQRIRALVQCYQGPGDFSVPWNGENSSGTEAVSGIYCCQLSVSDASGKHQVQKKMLLINDLKP